MRLLPPPPPPIIGILPTDLETCLQFVRKNAVEVSRHFLPKKGKMIIVESSTSAEEKNRLHYRVPSSLSQRVGEGLLGRGRGLPPPPVLTSKRKQREEGRKERRFSPLEKRNERNPRRRLSCCYQTGLLQDIKWREGFMEQKEDSQKLKQLLR